MIPYLELSMWSRGVRVVGGVNDAPILFGDPHGQTRQARMPINWWLMPGQNLLTVRVELLAGAEPPLLDVAIAFPEDEDPPLCRVGWGMPDGVEFAPFDVRLPFHPPKVGQSRVWHDATVIEDLSEPQRKGAKALAMEIHGAFANRDVDAIMKRLDYRLEEMVLAFEVDPNTHPAGVREDMEGLVQRAGYGVEPLDQDAIQVNPCCGGRIFQLARADGGPLIRTLETETSAPTTMQVYAALIRGEWRVVR